MGYDIRDDFTDKLVELFHPDMNFPDILGAIKSLLDLFENATAATAPPLSYFRLVAKCKVALWEDRPTQLEKDTAPAAQAEDVLGHRALFPDMDDDEIIEEIQRLQRSDQNVRRLARFTEGSYGEFRDRALLESTTLVEALSKVSTWDTENAVHQAMRNAPEDQHVASNGGLWDTFSSSYLKEILERWGVSPYLPRGAKVVSPGDAARSEHRGVTAERLWQLLDDIDTLSDKIKPSTEQDYLEFYRNTLAIAKHRHQWLTSDGNKLMWPGWADNIARGAPSVEPQKPIEILLSCPVCHVRHIDVGEFRTKPHHTHACQGCGHVWRPAKEPTVGVQYLSGYKNAPHGQELVGKRVRVLAGQATGHVPLGETYLVTSFDGPYFNQNEERYLVLMGTGQLRLRREEFEAL